MDQLRELQLFTQIMGGIKRASQYSQLSNVIDIIMKSLTELGLISNGGIYKEMDFDLFARNFYSIIHEIKDNPKFAQFINILISL